MFSLGWLGGISDTECSYWVSCGGGYDVRQASHLISVASEESFLCIGSVVSLQVFFFVYCQIIGLMS